MVYTKARGIYLTSTGDNIISDIPLRYVVGGVTHGTSQDDTRVLAVQSIGLHATGPPRTPLGKRLMQCHGPASQDHHGHEACHQTKDLKWRDLADELSILLSEGTTFTLGRRIGIVKVHKSHLVEIPHDDTIDEIAREVFLGNGFGILG